MDTLKYVIYGFIALIIIIFSVVLLGKSWDPVKYILNYGEEEVVEDTPESITSEFKNIAANFEECFNSKDDNCLCNIKILTFPKGYMLAFIKDNLIEINRAKIENVQTSVSWEQRHNFGASKNLRCYVTYEESKTKINDIIKLNRKKEDMPVYLVLDSSPKVVLIYHPLSIPSSIVLRHLETPGYDDYEFFDKMFYKQGNNICFILKDELSSEGQAHINELSRCSPKPLNT